MSKPRRKKSADPSPLADGSMRKCCFTFTPRVDQLISTEAKRRKITRSRLLSEVLAEHFKGVRICWPGEQDGQAESAA